MSKKLNLIDLAKCAEDTFLSKGFKNWKKALEKFAAHENSQVHKLAMSNTLFKKRQESIQSQMNVGILSVQERARCCLLKVVSSLKYLAAQGLAIQGKSTVDGNFKMLLQLRGEDDEVFKSRPSRKHNYASAEIQNELLKIMSHTILRNIIQDVSTMSTQFGIVVDGTQDIQGHEQESICIRYVTDSFQIKEDFLGLYNISSTSGESVCAMILDTLLRFQLPIKNLRSQTFDGAANMAGTYRGCQAELKKHQPLARYIHCGAHITHLVTSKAIQEAPFMKDALDHLQELGRLFGVSGKFKNMYLTKHDGDTDTPAPGSLKPICPTRWLTRLSAVTALLDNYSDVLDALQKASAEFGTNTGSRANGLYTCLSSGKCVLGLLAALPLLKLLECLNRSLQSSNINVDGMLQSVRLVQEELANLREEDKFLNIFRQAEEMCDDLQLEAMQLPRKRKVPRRYDHGNGQGHHHEKAEDHYRVQFFTAIDCASASLLEYFTSSDLQEYKTVSNMLFTSDVNTDAIQKYPELDESSLSLELQLYRRHYKGSTLEEHRKHFNEMDPAVRRMFPAVELL